jgi:hypothetical protein
MYESRMDELEQHPEVHKVLLDARITPFQE